MPTSRTQPKPPVFRLSLARDFSLFSAIILFVVFLSSIWFALQIYETQTEHTLRKLKVEAAKIDRTLTTTIDHAAYIMRSVARQILLFGPEDYSIIARLLHTFDQNIQFYSFFSWIDRDGRMRVSSQQGVLEKPVDLTDRTYLRQARLNPWTLQIGQPTLGRVTNKKIVPVAMGIADDSGNYLGTIQVSIYLDGLKAHLEQVVASPNIDYALITRDGAMLLQSSANKDFIGEYFQLLAGEKPRVLPSRFARQMGFSLVEESSEYAYYMLLNYNSEASEREILNVLLPRMLQIIFMAFFLLTLLVVTRRMVIKPVLALSQTATAIAQGKRNIVIPEGGSIEIAELAKRMRLLRDYMEERQLVENELREKVIHLKQARDQIEMSDRSKSEFLACISHELRTPLNTVIGFGEMMEYEMLGEHSVPQYRHYAADISRAGKQLLSMINDILDISKVEAGILELYETRVQLERIVTQCLQLLEGKAEEQSVHLAAMIPENLPVILVDALRLKQILINVMSNAIKFSRSGGRVVVSAIEERHGPNPRFTGGMLIMVHDEGIGMHPDEIPTAMKKFGRVESDDAALHRESGGLGLPLSQHLIELHGGELYIESVKGKGTTVVIRIPASRVIREG